MENKQEEWYIDKQWNHQKLLTEYNKNKLGLSTKQIKYIQNLYNNITDENIKSKYLGQMTKLDQLDEDEIFVLIENLKTNTPVDNFQFIQILNLFDDVDVQSLSKKDITELTFKDAERLLNSPDKFTPWIREHPIIIEEEWEYGWQESSKFMDNKMMYLKFYNMLMLDLDLIKITEKDLINILKSHRQYRFRLYKTYNGYHVFITSELINYRDQIIFNLTRELKADIHYTLFAYKTGFKIRLNAKKDRNEPFVSKYITDIGLIPMHDMCKKLIKIHDSFFDHGDK